MMYDQVVAVLVAEGYSPNVVRVAMDLIAEDDWRDEDDEWNNGDLRLLRKRLGEPVADVPTDVPAPPPPDSADSVPAAASPDATTDPRYDTDLWAADLTRVLERTTGGEVPLGPEHLRQLADHLLHRTSGLWDANTGRPSSEGASYVPDFSIERWADHLHDSLQAVTDGRIEVTRVELQVAANLLLHAREDDWQSQAALLRVEHLDKPADSQ